MKPRGLLTLIGAALAVLLSARLHACMIVPFAEALPPEEMLRTATKLYFGKVRTMAREKSSQYMDVYHWVVDIRETLKGPPTKVTEISLPSILLPDCPPPRRPGTGDGVIVRESYSGDKPLMTVHGVNEVGRAYISELRALARKSQSNPTVETDARKSRARGSP